MCLASDLSDIEKLIPIISLRMIVSFFNGSPPHECEIKCPILLGNVKTARGLKKRQFVIYITTPTLSVKSSKHFFLPNSCDHVLLTLEL